MKDFLHILLKGFVPLLFIIFTLPSYAQEGGNAGDGSRIEALKIAYITKKLNLSPEEAQRFWPVYNNYAKEIKQTRSDQRRDQGSELETEEKILTIRKKYNTEFSKVLSPDKVNTFFRAEKEFGNYVQKELMERRQLRQQLQDNRDSDRK